ncbi:hypothetical protein [Candidatus Epulonipiscium viviparus]|uniref:hypothetical protein n=1 Tax=Candidatus Epulonipiscium viviparus TaxID=420336 RepID=UPI0027380C51|nr:hypothetical protein [Candidatus Epulopiscium viviparus]
MKLFKKMTIAICSVMAVASFQVSVMAASDAIIDREDMIIGSTLGYKMVAGEAVKDDFNIFINTTVPYKNEQFLIRGTDIAFNKSLYDKDITPDGTETVVAKYLTDTTIRVGVTNISSDKMFMVPLYLEVVGENPSVEIVGNGGISSQIINLSEAAVSDQNIKIEFGKTRNIPIEGEGFLGEVAIEEVIPGALKSPTTVMLTLETNSGLVFDTLVGHKIKLEGSAGLAGTETWATVTAVTANDQQLILELPSLDDNNIKGNINIIDLPVKPENRKVGVICEQVYLNVSANDVTKRGVVSDVVPYDIHLSSDHLQTFVAGGKSETIEFAITENVSGSLDNDLDLFISTTGAQIINFEEQTIDGINFKAIKDYKGKIVEIIGKMTPEFDESISNDIHINLELIAGVNDRGDVTVAVECRNFAEDLSVPVGKIENTVNVTKKTANLKIGLKDQIAGEIVIAESKANVLEKYEQIIVEIAEAEENDIRIKDAHVYATNGIEVKSEIMGDYIVIDITRQSAAPGKVVISDLEFTVGQDAPYGSYDIKVSGSAISGKNATLNPANFKASTQDPIVVKNFAVLSQNLIKPEIREVVKEVPVKVEVVKEVIKEVPVEVEVEKKVIVPIIDLYTESVTRGNIARDLTATPVKTANGNLMLAVRDIATVFGLDESQVVFVGKKTIVNDAIEIEQGSDVLNIAGLKLKMTDKVANIGGRAYVPIEYMALALGSPIKIK